MKAQMQILVKDEIHWKWQKVSAKYRNVKYDVEMLFRPSNSNQGSGACRSVKSWTESALWVLGSKPEC